MPVCLHLTPNNYALVRPINSNHQPVTTIRSRFLRVFAAELDMTANSVRVAAAQMTSINDLAANFATCSRLVKEAASAGAKLLCLPESFSYVGAKDGDSVKIAEPLDGPTMQKYRSLARESSIWLSLGGFQEKGSDDEHLCNTHVVIDDAGNITSTYQKIHLFDVDVPGGRVYKESSFTEAAASAGAKLLCLPESFSYVGAKDGDSVKIAEPLDGPTMQKYRSLARESSIWLSLGGFQEKGSDDEHLCNTHVVIDDAGNITSTYQKIHLFDVDVPGGRVYKESSFTEAAFVIHVKFPHLHFGDGSVTVSARKDIVAVDSPVGHLGLTVCYDLRFPELYQQLRFQHDAQAWVLLVPSAFTAVTGQAHWELLLRARAVETQCYVVAATQAGKHNEKRESYGDALIIDPWGTVVGRLPVPGICILAASAATFFFTSSSGFPVSDRVSTGIAVADIDFSLIESVRAKMPIAKVTSSNLSQETDHSE
ncbi:Nitrilase-like protein 2 [Morella rubra]|uniref:Nitrilase-like protein 2 n=1 Tax=Morella rubra TaxID=262757 RepID=A0A6A1VZ77_9ROSI|nr:Nitrilase-like protein 2 [Morella rubra]